MPTPDPQADLVTAFDAGLDSYYGHVEHETRGNAELAARAVLSALGNPHERVAELERENSELESQLRGADQMARVDADMLDEQQARIQQLLRDLKAIEQLVDDELAWREHMRTELITTHRQVPETVLLHIREAARQAQASDSEVATTNADGVGGST